MLRLAPAPFARSLVTGLLLAAAGPLAAQTWFELDRESPPAGRLSDSGTLLEADLDSLRQDVQSLSVRVRLSWAEPRHLSGSIPVRSVQAEVEVLCPTTAVQWVRPRFFSERQAQGTEVPLPSHVAQSLLAIDWLPLTGQAKLVRSACGRQSFRMP